MKEIALESGTIAVQDLVQIVEQGETVVLTKAGEPRYVFGAMDDFEREIHVLSNDQGFLDYLEELRVRSRSKPTVSLGEVRRRLDGSEMPES